MPRFLLPRAWNAALVLLALVAGLAVSPATTARLDLDVLVPSGSPLDWTSMTPQRYLRPEGVFVRMPGESKDRYATAPVRTRPPMQGLARPSELLTLDFAGHLGWTEPVFTGRSSPTTGDRSALGNIWPLAADSSLYWRASGLLLQAMLHPGRVVRAEIGAELLLLGDGARTGLDAAGSLAEMKELADAVRRAIGPAPTRPTAAVVEAIAGAGAADDPAGALLLRFAADELCAAHPFANDFRFGRRLALLRDEVLPQVARLAEGPHALLRRNAIAFLGMVDSTPSTEALIRAVTGSDDAVARARAIHALGRRRAGGAASVLRSALDESRDPLLTVLLRHALGELDDVGAIPLLARKGDLFADDAESLLTRLAALARINARDQTLKVHEFVAPWLDPTTELRKAATVKAGGQGLDVPDATDMRAGAIVQLAQLIEWQLAPADAVRASAALRPFDDEPVASGRLTRRDCRTFGSIAPVVRQVFAERLGGCGTRGEGLARRIAADDTCEVELRIAALEGLPNPARLDLAADLALHLRSKQELPFRLALLELLDGANDKRAIDVARKLAGTESPRLADPEAPDEHWKLMLVAQALGRRNELSTERLIEALRSTDPAVQRPESNLTAWVEAFLDDALALGKRGAPLMRLATDLLTQVRRVRGSVPDAPQETSDETERELLWVVGQAEAVLEHRDHPGVRAAAVTTIVRQLEVGRLTRLARRAAQSDDDPFTQIPLRETLLMELARKADDAAVAALVERARDAKYPERGAACVALGATRRGDAATALLFLLRDTDPFVRLCAWAGLRRITSQAFFANWIDGDPKERERAAAEWARWLARNRK